MTAARRSGEPMVPMALDRDLTGGSRDGLYRALSYLERCGAPIISAPPEVVRMRREADVALRWLAGRDDRAALATDYETVVEHASPIFED